MRNKWHNNFKSQSVRPITSHDLSSVPPPTTLPPSPSPSPSPSLPLYLSIWDAVQQEGGQAKRGCR